MTRPAASPAAGVCPGCGHDGPPSARYSFRDPDGVFDAPLAYVACAGCGLAYLERDVDASALYEEAYYGGNGSGARFFDWFSRGWARRKARRFLRRVGGRRVLDMGCGRGDFLAALADIGVQVWGVEPQADALRILHGRFGDRVAPDLSALAGPREGFDTVTLWHVLEHVDAPMRLLAALASRVTPDGTLFIAVPNWNSLERRVFGDRWFHLDPPRHRLHFSEESLRRALDAAGWRLTSLRRDAWAYNFFGLFQTLLNVGPGPRNLFYRAIKRGGRVRRAPGFAVGCVWTALAAAPAAAIAAALTLVLTATGRAGTMEAVARKKASAAAPL